jgi:hypothetical protein
VYSKKITKTVHDFSTISNPKKMYDFSGTLAFEKKNKENKI